MEFVIKTFQNEEGIFAEITTKDGKQVCIGDGESPYEAIKDVCSVFSDIMDACEEQEYAEISKMVVEREKNDNGDRYSIEDVKKNRYISKK